MTDKLVKSVTLVPAEFAVHLTMKFMNRCDPGFTLIIHEQDIETTPINQYCGLVELIEVDSKLYAKNYEDQERIIRERDEFLEAHPERIENFNMLRKKADDILKANNISPEFGKVYHIEFEVENEENVSAK